MCNLLVGGLEEPASLGFMFNWLETNKLAMGFLGLPGLRARFGNMLGDRHRDRASWQRVYGKKLKKACGRGWDIKGRFIERIAIS